MPKIFARKPADVPLDHQTDPKLVKARKRLAEVEALLAGATERLTAHEAAVAAAEADVRRTELEMLVGRSSDAVLANKHAVLLDARRRRAVDVIAAEDAEAERERLLADLPHLELAAKRRSAAALRAKYLAAARDLRAALAAVVDADTVVAALVEDAKRLFPTNYVPNQDAGGSYLPGLEPLAGCGEISRTVFNRQVNLLQWEAPAGSAHAWLARVEQVVAEVEQRRAELDERDEPGQTGQTGQKDAA